MLAKQAAERHGLLAAQLPATQVAQQLTAWRASLSLQSCPHDHIPWRWSTTRTTRSGFAVRVAADRKASPLSNSSTAAAAKRRSLLAHDRFTPREPHGLLPSTATSSEKRIYCEGKRNFASANDRGPVVSSCPKNI